MRGFAPLTYVCAGSRECSFPVHFPHQILLQRISYPKTASHVKPHIRDCVLPVYNYLTTPPFLISLSLCRLKEIRSPTKGPWWHRVDSADVLAGPVPVRLLACSRIPRNWDSVVQEKNAQDHLEKEGCRFAGVLAEPGPCLSLDSLKIVVDYID